MELAGTSTMIEQDQRITEAVAHEQGRLRNFIRRRVANDADVEDLLQEVLYEVVEAYRLMKPIEQIGAWMFRVARNRRRTRLQRESRLGFRRPRRHRCSSTFPSRSPGNIA